MKNIQSYTEEEIKVAFRQRDNPKDTEILLKLSIQAKKIIEDAAREEDISVNLFIRKTLEEKILRNKRGV